MVHYLKAEEILDRGHTLRRWGFDLNAATVGVTTVSYHTFRHTFGTLLNANGANPKVVQELLRHASLKVTTDVYMQAVGPQKREAQSNLVRLVRKASDSEVKSSSAKWIKLDHE